MGEDSATLGWGYGLGDLAKAAPSVFMGAHLRLAHPVLDLGEGLFDWVEIRGIGRQRPEVRAGRSERAPHGWRFMGAEIVGHDDVAWRKRGNELLFDIGAKGFAVNGPVEDAGRDQPVLSQRADERHRAPVAIGRKAAQAFALTAPAAQGRHVGLDPCLVDEDEAARVKTLLPSAPTLASTGDVGAALLARHQGFF